MQEKHLHLAGHGGLKLFCRIWLPESAPALGSIVLVHGVNEHTGRYTHVAEFFTGLGLAVYAVDHRGHGQSEGDRAFINRFDEYLHDLRIVVAMAAEQNGVPIMLGHSMGGLISFRYALTYPETIRALVLTSPYFGLRVKVSAVEKALAPLLSRFLPKLKMPGKIGPADVCRDAAVARAYATDPMVSRHVTPRWFVECGLAIDASHAEAARVSMPVLFLQAEADRLVDPEATRAIYQKVAHERKAFKLYPGMYHEIMNDPDRQLVLEDIRKWLQQQELLSTV